MTDSTGACVLRLGGPVVPLEHFCHLLDERGRALCFADVAGCRIHPALPPGSYLTFPPEPEETCRGCGRPRCPTCAEIDRTLTRDAA